MVFLLLPLLFSQDDFFAGFHQPLGSGGRSADTDGACVPEQGAVYFLRLVYLIRVGIDLLAFLKQNLSVGTFMSADEEDQVVGGREPADVRHAVGHLPADGIEILERGGRRDVSFDVGHYLPELIQRFGCL